MGKRYYCDWEIPNFHGHYQVWGLSDWNSSCGSGGALESRQDKAEGYCGEKKLFRGKENPSC